MGKARKNNNITNISTSSNNNSLNRLADISSSTHRGRGRPRKEQRKSRAGRPPSYTEEQKQILDICLKNKWDSNGLAYSFENDMPGLQRLLNEPNVLKIRNWISIRLKAQTLGVRQEVVANEEHNMDDDDEIFEIEGSAVIQAGIKQEEFEYHPAIVGENSPASSSTASGLNINAAHPEEQDNRVQYPLFVRLSDEQYLEIMFDESPFIDMERATELAVQTNLNGWEVQRWFVNKVHNLEKQKSQMDDAYEAIQMNLISDFQKAALFRVFSYEKDIEQFLEKTKHLMLSTTLIIKWFQNVSVNTATGDDAAIENDVNNINVGMEHAPVQMNEEQKPIGGIHFRHMGVQQNLKSPKREV